MPFVLFLAILASCARSFHTLNPTMYYFDNTKPLTEEINVSYLYDIQNISRNKPYARKERKKYIKLVALKIDNNSDKELILTRDNFAIKTSSGRDIEIISNEQYNKAIRQYSGTYALFYGLSGFGYEWGEVNGEEYSTLSYNFLPLIIGVGNAFFAEASNNNQKQNMNNLQIYGKSLKPHSSMHGLIAIKDMGYPELNFYYYQDAH
jgi:hypothetical protein